MSKWLFDTLEVSSLSLRSKSCWALCCEITFITSFIILLWIIPQPFVYCHSSAMLSFGHEIAFKISERSSSKYWTQSVYLSNLYQEPLCRVFWELLINYQCFTKLIRKKMFYCAVMLFCFDILTKVNMKCVIFWDVMSCSLVEAYGRSSQYFGKILLDYTT
jgi:hypothetical protein